MTAFVLAGFVWLVAPWLGIEIPFALALLLASTMSSTDSASVFSILRSKKQGLKQNLRPLLELESGSNDPMAYMMTILLISVVSNTAREEDNTQGDHTHELGHLDRTIRDEIQTEQHAHPEEQQQRGGPETIRNLTGHHRHEEQQCAYQYFVFTTDVYHSSPFMLRYALSTMFSLVSGLYSRSAYSNACMAAKLLSGVR